MVQVDREALATDGALYIPEVIGPLDLDWLETQLAPLVGNGVGDRSLHHHDGICELATRGPMAQIASQILGAAFVARILYFDKHADANWKVPWHQDLVIAVKERIETEGFGGWSIKAGMTHVRAPAEVLSNMIALRLHLDDCGADNGPLRVSPGTHLNGVLPKDQIPDLVASHGDQTCTAARGGVIAMRPLVLHASSPASVVGHRRVIHVEYAAVMLPGDLQWALGYPVDFI